MKVAGEAFVVVGTEVGMLVGIIIILLELIIIMELLIVIVLLIVLLMVEPNIAAAA